MNLKDKASDMLDVAEAARYLLARTQDLASGRVPECYMRGHAISTIKAVGNFLPPRSPQNLIR